jgi:hypothetical protein
MGWSVVSSARLLICAWGADGVERMEGRALLAFVYGSACVRAEMLGAVLHRCH